MEKIPPFLNVKNKQMLWDIIYRDIFNGPAEDNKSRLHSFDDQMSRFYSSSLDKSNLTEMNKQFISQVVKKKQETQIKITNTILPKNIIQIENLTRDKNVLDKQFQEKVAEYGDFLKKAEPIHVPNFSDNLNDEKPISNMEELIQETIMKRKYDIPLNEETEIKSPIKKKISWGPIINEGEDNIIDELKEIHNLLEQAANKIELLLRKKDIVK
jgi:hypothetical protein